MKKTVGVLSLLVMLLSQVFSPFAYAVSGDETTIEEPKVVDEETIENDTISGNITEPGNPLGVSGNVIENNITIENNSGDVEMLSGTQTEILSGDVENVTGKVEILSGEQEKLEGNQDTLSGSENSSGFFENLKEGIVNLLGLGLDENDDLNLYGSGQNNQLYTISFDTNGGSLKDSIVVTGGQKLESSITKYSHTINVGDNGIQNGNYAVNFCDSDVVTIPGAESLKVTVTYGTDIGDFVYVVEGNHPEYSRYDYSKSLSNKLGGGSHLDAENTKIYDVSGDTVTFVFNSDSSSEIGDGYGYYAVIEGTGFYVGNNPVMEGKVFDGWYKDEDLAEKWGYNDIVDSDLTLYAKRRDYQATFLLGNDFNRGIRTFVNGTLIADSLIKKVLRADSIPNNVTTLLVSSEDSEVPIYAWFDSVNGILYYYSTSEKIYFNYSVSQMFAYMSSLKVVDLSDVDMSKVKKANEFLWSSNSMKIIYAKDRILQNQIGSTSNHVFGSSTNYSNNIVGGNGTKYDSYNDNFNFARPDTELQSGYFTNPDAITVRFKVFGNYYGDKQILSRGQQINDPGAPNITGYEFKGWYEDPDFKTPYDFSKGIEEYTELYARMDGNEAVLLSGKEFILAIKKLANTNITSYDADDYSINQIVRTGSLDESIVNKSIISESYSKYPVYAWYQNVGGTGTIYYYTEAPKIYMNRNSEYMFSYLHMLKEIDVGNFDTSRVENMRYMFSRGGNGDSSWNLKITGLETWNTKNVTNMEYMFYYNKNIKNIDISSFNFSSLETVNGIFYGCSNIESINISNIKNVKYISYLFSNSPNLNTLIMDNWDLSNITNWNSQFDSSSYPQNLHYVSMRNLIAPKSLDYFYNFFVLGSSRSKIRTLDVTNRDLSKTETMHEMFYNIENLYTLIGLETWKTDNVKDMSEIFRYSSLTGTYDLSNWNVSNVEKINQMFEYSHITGVNISGRKLNNVKDMRYMFGHSDIENVNLTNLVVNNLNGEKTDLYEMFVECHNLEQVNMTNVYMSGVDMSYMFQNSDNFREIIGDSSWTVENISNMRGIFYGCSNLSKINLIGFKTENLSNMGMAFYRCSSIQNIDLSSFDTNNVTTIDSAFHDAINLRTIYVGKNFNLNRDGINSSSMFLNAINIVGQNGTVYDPNNIDKTYARVDKQGNPGYLTNGEYDIIYELDGGEIEGEKNNYYTSETFDLVQPSKEGYTFEGWTGSNGAVPMKNVNISKGTTGDLNFYAVWSPIEYWIIFKNGDEVKQQLLTYNEESKLLKNEFIITGYTFSGWYDGENMINYEDEETVYNLTTESGKVLIFDAVWTPNKYDVLFYSNTGTDTLKIQKFVYGERQQLTGNTFTKDGYYFNCWNMRRDGEGTGYSDKESVMNLTPTENGIIKLYAQWLQNPSAAGGGRTITPTKEQEHNAAEEDKQKEDKDEETIDETEKEIQVKRVPSSTNNASTQTTTRTTTNTSVDPLISSAYEWAYEHNITTISSLDDANPDGTVTRGHLAKMVVNYATNVLGREIPEKIPSYCRWNDRKTDRESEEIKDYAVKSCALGLMGLDMEKFLPNMEVTRAQFGTIMSRLLWGKKYAGGTPYYRKHLNALKENNIMTQIENPEKRIELRQRVWVMLMRSAENK